MPDLISVPYTPDPGQPISINDIHRVFGKGNEPTSPGYELDNYNGVRYWSSFYPFASGTFPASGQLQLSDFYGKCAEDPVKPGTFIDDTPGVNKILRVPPFRIYLRIDIWGAGGGAGAADKGGYYNGSPGSSSSILQIITAGGGGAGTGGYRYGNQNGAGGAGGIVSYGTIPAGVQYGGSNGESGFNGNAGGGYGSRGGNSPNGGAGGAAGGYNTSNYNGRNAGEDGYAPGGGGGSGGYSEFRSKNVSRAAGGSGGGGAYAYLIFNRTQLSFGQIITYTVGARGAGNPGGSQPMGPGGSGAPGRVKFTWDI